MGAELLRNLFVHLAAAVELFDGLLPCGSYLLEYHASLVASQIHHFQFAYIWARFTVSIGTFLIFSSSSVPLWFLTGCCCHTALPPIYAVALAKKNNKHINIHNLEGRRSCHSHVYSPGGWLLPSLYTVGALENEFFSCNISSGENISKILRQPDVRRVGRRDIVAWSGYC